MRNWVIYAAAIVLTAISLTVSAGKDPFKKNKKYDFLDDINWYQKNSMLVKAGSVREYGDTFYYHLSVNTKQLRLHLGKNDPSGESNNSRQLDYISIIDVTVDGETLPRFKWCLNNQLAGASSSLKKNARVTGGSCVNAGDDFMIKLDDKTFKQLMSAKTIGFEIEPFGNTINLSYSMGGFADLMTQMNKPVVVAKKVETPKPVVKKERTCYAQPPAEFKSSVKRIAYPCDNNTRKTAASQSIDQMVAKQRQQQAALVKKPQQATGRKVSENRSQEEMEFERKQIERWVTRCRSHWDKGVSPCYCQKYLKFAPAGTQDSCSK